MNGVRAKYTALAFVLVGIVAHADSFHLIVCGSGGDPEFVERFADWGRRLQTALVDVAQNDPTHVRLLTEVEPAATDDRSETKPVDVPGSTVHHSDLESIRAAIEQLASVMQSEDEVFVYLIGHGSHRRDEAKIMIPGPDLSAQDLGGMLEGLPAGTRVAIDSTSSSAAFINALGPSNIIVCTATKSVEERNATEFMEHFIQAIEEGSADTDHDGRMSVYEVCSQAAILTAAWYENEGLIASEHALLEDNGDGLGTRLPIETEAGESQVDGDRAKTVFIKAHDFPASVPRELIQEYEAALQAVEDLKKAKESHPEEQYYEKLGTLLVRAARANRAIREAASAADATD